MHDGEQVKHGRVLQSWSYIMSNAKLIQSKKRRSDFTRLLQAYTRGFIENPASVKRHHNKEGGLAIHTAQVLKRALALFRSYRAHLPNISIESVYVVAVLHDLAKTQHYKPSPAYPIDRPYQFEYDETFKPEHDVWTIAVANKFDLQLTYDEMMGILQAHGGWSKISEPINKLAVIIHCADMLSSQILKK